MLGYRCGFSGILDGASVWKRYRHRRWPCQSDSTAAALKWAALTTGFPGPRSSASAVNQRAAILKVAPACLLSIHQSDVCHLFHHRRFFASFLFSRSLLNSPLFSGPASIFIPPFPREESCRWRRLGDLLLVAMATLSKARVKQAHACCLSRTCFAFFLFYSSCFRPILIYLHFTQRYATRTSFRYGGKSTHEEFTRPQITHPPKHANQAMLFSNPSSSSSLHQIELLLPSGSKRRAVVEWIRVSIKDLFWQACWTYCGKNC